MWPFKKKTRKPYQYDWEKQHGRINLGNGTILVGDAARQYREAIANYPPPPLRVRRGGQCDPAPGRLGPTPPPLPQATTPPPPPDVIKGQ